MRLYVLIWDTQEILDNGRIILRDLEENKSLSYIDITVSNSTVDYIWEYLNDHSSNEASSIEFKNITLLVNNILSQINLV